MPAVKSSLMLYKTTRKQKSFFSAPRGNLVPSSVNGSEQPGNKAGKGDTTAVITWAEKLLYGPSKTVVTTWASLSKN